MQLRMMPRATDIEYYHVYPVDDLRPHETEGDPCRCHPVYQYIGSGQVMVIHNAFDGRDLKEIAEQRMN